MTNDLWSLLLAHYSTLRHGGVQHWVIKYLWEFCFVRVSVNYWCDSGEFRLVWVTNLYCVCEFFFTLNFCIKQTIKPIIGLKIMIVVDLIASCCDSFLLKIFFAQPQQHKESCRNADKSDQFHSFFFMFQCRCCQLILLSTQITVAMLAYNHKPPHKFNSKSF